MLTDGYRIKIIRKKIDPNEFEYIPDIPLCEQKLSMHGNCSESYLPMHMRNTLRLA